MTYREAVDYISDIPKFSKKNTPANTRLFLRYLGDPQEKLKVIHVAGTNGKGSVCAYINAMLLAQKESAGLFVSPHLVKMNERIAVNGDIISDGEFLDVFEYVMGVIKKMRGDGLPHPAFFEILFGMALAAFERAEVKYAVLETGLGGRLDATTQAGRPCVSVITPIGYDHMSVLGDTLEEIAFEKAGIIKEGVPLIYAQTYTPADKVIQAQAEKKGAPAKKIGKDAYKILGIRDKHIAFLPVDAYYEGTVFELNNIGVYQPGNAMLALEAMRLLFGSKGDIGLWRDTLKGFTWEGRMEEAAPGFYIDGAHNISAVQGFADTVSRAGAPHIILFSALADKEYEKMIAYLCANLDTDFYVVTKIDDERAAQANVLKDVFGKYTKRPVYVRESLSDALSFIAANRDGRRVYCLGSLYLAGMIKRRLKDAGF